MTRSQARAVEANEPSEAETGSSEDESSNINLLLGPNGIHILRQMDARLKDLYMFISNDVFPGDPKLARKLLSAAPDY